ncbi:hypothetical protein BC835DRAFT_1425377 [Cytidiella melzeri]|nr:hypothetical protein BC835DRAFT_1425377 [Cytidiella melzeri]
MTPGTTVQSRESINCHASSFRSHLRDKICGRIVRTYGLKSDTSKDGNAKANVERVAWLLQSIGEAQDANRYCYEEFTLERPWGLAQISIICHALQEVFFRNSASPGAEFRAIFDPLPLPTIALLLAMEQKGHEFRKTTYKQIVKQHLVQLEDWARLDAVITTKICYSLFKNILHLGGIEHIRDKPLGLLDTAKQNTLQDLAT